MAEIIAIANQKGGIGKTTTALAVTSVLKNLGKRVLYVDIDPQCNGTDTYQAAVDGVGTIYDLMVNMDFDCVQRTEHGDIIAGDPMMKDANKHLDDVSAVYRLRKGLEHFKDWYDYIILDTPPALSILLTNALTAADKIIIPLTADRYGLQGLVQLHSTIEDVKEYTNPKLTVDGLLLVKYSDRTNLEKGILDSLPEYAKMFNTRVYKTRIRESVRAREAQAKQMGLIEWAPKSTTALDYKALVNEILNIDASVDAMK